MSMIGNSASADYHDGVSTFLYNLCIFYILMACSSDRQEAFYSENGGLLTKQEEDQSGLRQRLDEILNRQRHLEMSTSGNVSGLKSQISQSVQSALRNDSGQIDLSRHDRNVSLPFKLAKLLDGLKDEDMQLEKQLGLVQSLDFPKINDRRDNIPVAHPQTYEWLFNETGGADTDTKDTDDSNSLLEWLRAGSGVYWVCGKAGSGKSTLMKFLVRNHKTTQALSRWAGEQSLGMAAFYFWSAGSNMQKSQKGLCQSLLQSVFKQCPELIPRLCPTKRAARITSQSV